MRRSLFEGLLYHRPFVYRGLAHKKPQSVGTKPKPNFKVVNGAKPCQPVMGLSRKAVKAVRELTLQMDKSEFQEQGETDRLSVKRTDT